jgi:hypothetical protein
MLRIYSAPGLLRRLSRRRIMSSTNSMHACTRRNFVSMPSNDESDLTSHLVSQRNSTDQTSPINDYWIRQLHRVERQVARDMIPKLVPDNALGYVQPGSKMLQFVIEQKLCHPEKVIVLRCGDFYEVYGIDAVMFVAYCGLNPMRGPKIVRAGCPIASIQATLDGLTSAGLSVAIYEEVDEPDTAPGPASKRPKAKQRVFSHIVSPGATVYPYKLALKAEDIDFQLNKAYFGVQGTGALLTD